MSKPEQIQEQRQQQAPINAQTNATITVNTEQTEQRLDQVSQVQAAPAQLTEEQTTQVQEQNADPLSAVDQRELERWEMVNAFRKKSGEAELAKSNYKDELGQLDLFGLRDALKDDSKSKSGLFNAMYDNLDALLKLSDTKGKTLGENGAERKADFGETLFAARQSVHDYLSIRSRQIHIFSNGKKRLDIAERVERLLDQLSENINARMEALSEKEKRMAKYERDNLTDQEIEELERIHELDENALDKLNVIRTGEFGPKMDEEQKKKVEDNWLAGNFTKELMKLLDAPEKIRGKEAKNDFLAALTDKNNLLLANKMTLTVLVDADTEATLGMPWLKDELKLYIDRNIPNEKYLEWEPEQMAKETKRLIKAYADEYKKELAECKERQDKLLDLIPSDTMHTDRAKLLEDIYSYPEVKNLLMFDDPEQFEERLDVLRRKVEEDDKEIDEQLLKYYSQATVTNIRIKLNGKMAGVRLFGSTEEVLNLTGLYRSELQYLAPHEYKTERMLNRLMDKYNVPRILKDHFLETITIGMYDELDKHDFDFWKSAAEEYAENYQENEKYFGEKVLGESLKSKFLSFFGRKTVSVPETAWEELEELRLMSGQMKNSEFKDEVKRIIQDGARKNDRKLTREEYLTRRRFHDDEKKKVRIQHAKREEETITKIGNTYDDKFLILMSNEGKDELEHYSKTDLIYRGSDAFEQLRDDYKKLAGKEVREKRTAELKNKLKEGGVPEDKLDEYVKKLSWMTDGINDTTSELHEDERLECERINLEKYGVRTFSDALARLEKYIPSLAAGESHQDITEAKTRYEKGIEKISSYEGGRYKEIADILTAIPEVYAAVTSSDEKALDDLLKDKIDPKFASITETLSGLKKDEFHGEAIYKQYVYSNLKGIYAGNISGDKKYHMQRIKDYSSRMYKVRINENFKKVEDALNKKYAALETHKNDDKKKKFKPLGDEIVLTGEIKYMLMLAAADTEKYEQLLDSDALVKEALKLYEAGKDRLNKEMVYSNETIEKTSMIPLIEDPIGDLREEYAQRKQKGKEDRAKYLNLSFKDMDSVLQGKSLIRVAENGRGTVSLDSDDAKTVRGELLKQVDFILPPVLRDAIIEEGAGRGFRHVKNFTKFDQSNPMNGVLYRHAHRMYALYNSLLRETEDDPAMSEEEAQMFAVRMYANVSGRSFFDSVGNTKGQEQIAKIRKSEDYKVFRENYKKLLAFESEKMTDPSLKVEQEDMARYLRVLLTTNVGLKIKGEDGKALRFGDLKKDVDKAKFGKKIGKAFDEQLKYLKSASELEKVLRTQVDALRSKKGYGVSEFYKDSEVLMLREHYMSDLIKDLKEGKEFSETEWNNKVAEFLKDKNNRDALMSEKDSVTSEDLIKRDSERVDSIAGENVISNIIRKSAAFFHGRSNMYEQLDEDQKVFFAAALMLMDKGAIGQGTLGTESLLYGKDKKKQLAGEIGEQLKNYVQGKEYHINIDYRDAAYKLLDYQNVGMMSLKNEYVISRDAYEQALLFARTMYQKKQSFNNGEKDMDRVRDGYASIEAAFLQDGKLQKNEIDRLSVEPMSKEDVISRLIEYAKQEQGSLKGVLAGAGMIAVGGAAAVAVGIVKQGNEQNEAKEKAIAKAEEKKKKEKGADATLTDDEKSAVKADISVGNEALDNTVAAAGLVTAAEGIKITDQAGSEYLKMKKVLKRLEKLESDDEELKLFLRVMQDRTVLDISCADGSKHVDQDKRDLLFNALTGDARIASETLSGFADNESCHQAYMNALSFQLRDDAFFKDKMISKDHFAKGALDRKSTVDWALLEKAFDFIDEIKDRRATVLATTHAVDYIRESGNDAAIKELDKLEKDYGTKKEEFGLKDIENKLKDLKTVNFGYMSGGQEEVERAWSGYLGLSDQDKNLFYKVLLHRDLLDISKKDYVRSYFGIADRNYLNASGRNALLNEYVQATLGDGIGVQLDKDAYYKAFESLLSTQVSDIVNFRGKTELDGKVKGIFSYERLGFFGRGCAIDWKLFKRALNFVERAKTELKTQEGNALLYQGAGDLAENGHIDVDYSFLRRNIHKTGNQWLRKLGQIGAKRVKEETGLDGILETVNGIVNTVKDVSKIIGISENGVFGKTLNYVGSITGNLKESSDKLGSKHDFKGVSVQSEEKYKESLKTEEKKEQEKKKKEEKEKKRRDELLFYDQIKEGFDNIAATKKSVSEAVEGMKTFLNQKLDIYRAGQLQKKDAEKDKDNIVYQTVGGQKLKEKGDSRDIKAKIEDKKETFDDISNIVGQIPFAKNVKALLTYGIEKAVYGSLINDQFLKKDIHHDKDGNEVDLTRAKEIEVLKKNASDFVKDQVENITVDVFGQGFADKLKSTEQFIYDNKKLVGDGIKYINSGIKLGKECVETVMDINKSVNNLRSLNRGAEDAKAHHEEDEERLRKAGEKRLNAKQLEKAGETNDMHIGMGGMSKTIADAMQKFNIAQDVINLTIDSVNTFGGQFNYPQKLLSGLIQDGLEMAMFAIKVCTDRKALQDYLFTTKAGLKIVDSVQSGFKLAADSGSESGKNNADKLERVKKDYSFKTQIKNPEMVDIISDAKGYEHTSELVEDVGMQMAQSLVFCASKFNPMMETKLMAITVMSVMGMSQDEIGKTTSDVTRKLFDSFKMSR